MLQLLDVKTKHLDIKDQSDQSDHQQPSRQETSANDSRLKVATTEKELSPGLVPLAQRQNRREVKNKKSEEPNCENEDLKFIETLDRPQHNSLERVEVEDKPS